VSEERDDPPAAEAPASAAPEPPAEAEQPAAFVKLPEGLESTLPDDAPRIVHSARIWR